MHTDYTGEPEFGSPPPTYKPGMAVASATVLHGGKGINPSGL